jgi:plastocyanin
METDMERTALLATPRKSRGRAVLVALALSPPLALLPLAACEGEPPVNSPENTIAAASAPGSASASASVAAPEAASAPAQLPCAPPPCAPGSAAPAIASAAVPVGGPAPEASASGGLPVPPVEVVRGNIVGNVTTQPPALKGLTVIYLEEAPDSTSPAPPGRGQNLKEDTPAHLQTVTIANKQMTFIPYVSVAAVGAKVVFTNEDPFPHNVFSPDGDRFNMGNIPQNGAHYRVFKNPGAYSLLCNLHPGMLGYLVVTPSTFYARADAKGAFSMKHVPAGTYKVTAWAPRLKPQTQSVTVDASDVTVNFDLKR